MEDCKCPSHACMCKGIYNLTNELRSSGVRPDARVPARYARRALLHRVTKSRDAMEGAKRVLHICGECREMLSRAQ